jgi:acyl carrier protein
MKTEAEIRAALRVWLIQRNGWIKPDELTDETPIIEQRIVSSLQITDLILFLEKLAGHAIDVERLRPGVFRSVDAIYNNFFAEQSHAK